MNLRQLRKAKGLTQKQLADQVGVTESSINQYENGKKKPKYETLLLLGEALDCAVSDIIGDNDLDEFGFSAYEQIIIHLVYQSDRCRYRQRIRSLFLRHTSSRHSGQSGDSC